MIIHDVRKTTNESAAGKDNSLKDGKKYLRRSNQLFARGFNDFSCTRFESSFERSARSDKIPNSVRFDWVVTGESEGILLHVRKSCSDVCCNAFH
jgi:hypothetical protein